MARIPEVQAIYSFDNATLGTVLLCSAIGAILAMPFTGFLTLRFGSRKLTAIAGFLFCLGIPFIAIMPSFAGLAILFFCFGMISGALDVSMNAQAVMVEKRWQKPIMSSFHAVFSVGTAIGAGSGALFARWQIGLTIHFFATAIFMLLLVLWAMTQLLPDEKTETTQESAPFQLPTKAILPLGLIAFCAMMGEGSMADWSALYMNKVLGQNESISALGFAAFATAMTIGRFGGDYAFEKWGINKALIISSLVSFFCLLLVLMSSQVLLAMIGFFGVGLGLAIIVPIVYSAAGNTEGVNTSVGISMATTIGYAGFFVGPPVIGCLADIFSLRSALFFPLALFVLMFFLAYNRKK